MKLYGIASRQSGDTDEFRATWEEAEAVLAEMLEDEPELADVLYVVEIKVETSEN